MAVIPEITCRRCGSKYSGLRNRCPKCGAPRINQPTRVPPTTAAATPQTAANGRAAANIRWQFVFGGVLLLALILAVIVLVNGGGGGSSSKPSSQGGAGTPAYIAADLPTPSPSPAPTPDASPTPVIESMAKDWCLTHIDAVPDNFLFYLRDGEEKLQLTDWEYAGMQDPHIDIAMFCCYSEYDKGHADHLIDLYFGTGAADAGTPGETAAQTEIFTRETRLKIYCYIAAAGLLWSNWCEYKRRMGVEFGEYADFQYDCAKKYYRIAVQERKLLQGSGKEEMGS